MGRIVGAALELLDVAGVLTIVIPASVVLGALAAYLGYLKQRK